MKGLWWYGLGLVLIYPVVASASKLIPLGVVTEVTGQAYYANQRNSTLIQIRPKQQLFANSSLKTKTHSYIRLKLYSGVDLEIKPKSLLSLDQHQHSDLLVLRQYKGQVRVRARERKMLIVSSHAVFYAQNNHFLLSSNPQTEKTILLNLHGILRWGRWDAKRFRYKDFLGHTSFRVLDPIQTLEFGPGYFSMIGPLHPPTLPARISPLQFEILREKSRRLNPVKKYIRRFEVAESRLPSGGHSRRFIVEPSGLAQLFKTLQKDSSQIIRSVERPVYPEGLYLGEKDFYAPPSGGFLEFESVSYISPDETSDYDPNSKTYVLNRSRGKIDLETGQYLPPEGMQFLPEVARLNKIGNLNLAKRGPLLWQWGRVLNF